MSSAPCGRHRLSTNVSLSNHTFLVRKLWRKISSGVDFQWGDLVICWAEMVAGEQWVVLVYILFEISLPLARRKSILKWSSTTKRIYLGSTWGDDPWGPILSAGDEEGSIPSPFEHCAKSRMFL